MNCLKIQIIFASTYTTQLKSRKFNCDNPVENILDRMSGQCRHEQILLLNEPFQKR